MPGEPLVNNALTCPHCRALHAPGILICRSCGINLPAYQEAQGRLQELQRDSATTHSTRLEADSSESITSAISDGRRQLTKQVRALLIAGAFLAIVIVIGSMLYANRLAQRREQLARQYEQGIACLAQAIYLCARDSFVTVLEEEPSYSDAAHQLQAARAGLAKQYADAGQWQQAIDEFDALLVVDPSDRQALEQLRTVYDRWYQDALAKGDRRMVLRIALERRARFPEPTPVPTNQAQQSG